ncbi:MAG TPA: hypothetical protein VIE90_13730 [Candidatus Binatia bacterium]
MAAMTASLAIPSGGPRQVGKFYCAMVPTWLIIGLYNKLVRLEGHDRYDRG